MNKVALKISVEMRALTSTVLFCLFLFPLSNETLAQGHLKVYYERTEDLQNCRVQIEDLKPVLAYDSPWIRNHKWDAVKLIESAELSEGRTLTLEPFGCLRYHLKLTLSLAPSVLENRTIGPGLYLQEILNMLRIVYYENEEYALYQDALEKKLIEVLKTLPNKKQVNFPLNEFNIFVEIDHTNAKGSVVQLEFVRFVHDEVIRLPGIKEHLDDGYYQGSLR